MNYFLHKVRWYVGVGLLLCSAITVMKYSAWIDHKLFGSSKRPRNVSQQSLQTGGLSSTLYATPSPGVAQPWAVENVSTCI